MALNRTNGVFSPIMFHPTVYDTGKGHSGPNRLRHNLPIVSDELRQILREDEEILPIIIAISQDM